MVPYFAEGHLAGRRYAIFLPRARDAIAGAWRQAVAAGRPLHLGHENFIASNVEHIPGPTWQDLALCRPIDALHLRFLSPTTFRQGPGNLPLPFPANIFQGPWRVWQAFAPPVMALSPDWLTWCERDVFVTTHQIETVEVKISQRETFTGFVGDVHFRAHKGNPSQRSIWHALATLAPFSGAGRKTSMGMGAIETMDTTEHKE
jgi:CRISPR-associated endoribonuclease Cas6